MQDPKFDVNGFHHTERFFRVFSLLMAGVETELRYFETNLVIVQQDIL
jgi:hypothetical protein